MALRYNLALRNQIADDFDNPFNSGTIEIRTGTQPADPDDAPTGTLLVTIDLPADALTPASGGTITKQGNWYGTITTSGTAGWARFISADTTKTFDVSVGESLADLIIDEAELVEDETANIVAFTFTVPSGV